MKPDLNNCEAFDFFEFLEFLEAHPIDFTIHPFKQKLAQLEMLAKNQPRHSKVAPQILEIKNILLYLEDLKKSGLARAIPNISEQTACVILQLLQAKKAKNILEIGCANGYSSLYWAAYCKYLAPDFYFDTQAKLSSIDISAPMIKEAIDHLLKQKLHLHTQVYWGDALAVLPRFRAQFDAVFVDAQKSKTIEILEQTLPLMEKNALLVIDDVIKFAGKMGDLFDFLKAKKINYHIVKTDEDDGILWAIL